tara:strand:- start:102 stop:263 length:162 start_codon:yes stop_codon:yes gene_type:complete
LRIAFPLFWELFLCLGGGCFEILLGEDPRLKGITKVDIDKLNGRTDGVSHFST